jgi:dihydrofolate synthase/folylpolyglutamate synthase
VIVTDYEDAVDYVLSFADFERSGRFQERPDVAPMEALLKALGDPHLGRRTVHVAGSKGKGSTAAMAESVLREAGIRTGLYTSPHLHNYTERIRIGGEPVSREEFVSLAALVREAVERVAPGLDRRRFVTFDLLTAMGFLAFGERAVDVQVVEVGLGGRVDSTNVFGRKEVAVITPISLEHTAILGDTVEEIAAEKAGIITPGCTVVLARQAYEGAEAVVRRRAEEVGAKVVEAARWCAGGGEALIPDLPLRGRHQRENACTAAAAVRALDAGLPDEAVTEGLASVRWPGRVEVLREGPAVVVDGAHSRDSARALREALAEMYGDRAVTFIVGSSADKDIGGLAEELAPAAERVYAVRSGHPRAGDPEVIAGAFRSRGVRAEDVDSVGAAVERAMAAVGEGGVICLTGSLFVVAEGREHFGLS